MFKQCSNILELDYFHFYHEFADLGNKFKRHNLRLDRNSERRIEIWEQRERELQKVFGKKLGNNSIRIERVHRVKDKRSQKQQVQMKKNCCKIQSQKKQRSYA